MKLQSPLAAGIWFTAAMTILGIGYAMLQPRPSQSLNTMEVSPVQLARFDYCQTIATDPNPPLNVRSSPVVASDNVVGRLANGTHLTVVDEQRGWLRVSAPVAGWVAQGLTVTSCDPSAQGQPQGQAIADRDETAHLSGAQLLAEAKEKFNDGNLAGALARLHQVPPQAAEYAEAQLLLKRLPLEWKQASDLYQQSEQALSMGQPQVVLSQMDQLPPIRYWRSQMAPLVKQAIEDSQTNKSQPAT